MTGLAATEGALLVVDQVSGVIFSCSPPLNLRLKQVVAELPRDFSGGDAAVDSQGRILVCDVQKGRVLRIAPPEDTSWLDDPDGGHVTGIAVDAQDRPIFR